jgi:hypothetical protein
LTVYNVIFLERLGSDKFLYTVNVINVFYG